MSSGELARTLPIPSWNEESRKAAIQLLQDDVERAGCSDVGIEMPVVQYNSSKIGAYRELDVSRMEIRILDMLLNDTSDPIICSLSIMPLNEDLEYAALSYVWGSSALTEEILLNGSPFKITKSLFSALRQLRERGRISFDKRLHKSLRLWVDALCINQCDNHERNAQVKLMGPIYGKAAIVISWMGLDDDIALAITALRGITRNLYSLLQQHKDIKLKPGDMTQNSNDLVWLTAMKCLCGRQYNRAENAHSYRIKPVTNNYIWDILRVFAFDTYWRRTWIPQEVVLGRKVFLVARDKAINFDDLRGFIEIFGKSYFKSRPAPHDIDARVWIFITRSFSDWAAIDSHLTMRWIYKQNGMEDFGLSILPKTRGLKATKSQDKVFGLLGMTDIGIVADYTKSTKSVYSEVASKWIASDEDFETLLILAGCGIHSNRTILDLPSWVPDWDALSTKIAVFDPHKYGQCGFNPAVSNKQLFSRPAASNNVLSVAGTLVTKVKSLSSISDDYDNQYYEHCKFIVEYLSTRTTPAYRTGIPHLQALFRLFLHDLDPHLNQRLSSNTKSFLSLALALLIMFSKPKGVPTSEQQKGSIAVALPKLNLSPGTGFASSFCTDFLGHRSSYVDSWTSAEDVLFLHPKHYDSMFAVAKGFGSNAGQNLFETTNGLVGVGPHGMKDQDLVCMLTSCKMPVILRKVESHYLFVGSCFVLGLMDGEALMPGPLGYLHDCELSAFQIH